ncbi:MAG: hypothetical protein M3383_07995 [Actinomycetota bacterium]|nr:hypothetical protein [Actinomycetota bacterium]
MSFEIKQSGGFRRRAAVAGFAASVALLAVPSGTAVAGSGGLVTGDSGGTVSGDRARLKANGQAVPPASAPHRVKRAIWAANEIEDKPYRYGGGHSRWRDSGYDCSGAVSYALGRPGAKVIDAPMPSSGFMRPWGRKGKGKWITVYANSGHMFAVIAGLRWDTSQPDDGRSGPGWSKDISAGFRNVSRTAARHPGRF